MGEIESRLGAYPGVKQAVVLAKEQQDGNGKANGNKYLVGYYVSNSKLDEGELLRYLGVYLPDYMLPNNLVHLQGLPMTINGKLDIKALPNLEFKSGTEYVAPRSQLESDVCRIFAEVLGLAQNLVGIDDNFFRLGGDSIISIQLVSTLRKSLNLNLSVKDIFKCKTVEALCKEILLKQTGSINNNIIREDGELKGSMGLLPIQEWFFEKAKNTFRKPGHWNQAFLIKVRNIDQKILKHSIEKLVAYHDSFRLAYTIDDLGNYHQYYNSHSEISIKYLNRTNLTDEELETKLTKLQSGFKLARGNALYSFAYIDGYADGSSRIFFALHHLLIDVVSWRIIVDDLQALYNQLIRSPKEILQKSAEEILGKKGTSYRQWIEIIEQYKIHNREEREYWQLPEDLSYEAFIDKASMCQAGFTLDNRLTKMLLTEANHSFNTEINDLLLSAFGLVLAKLTNNNTNYIVLEGHGREEILTSNSGNQISILHQANVTRTVGWFTTMYPVKLEVNPDSLENTIIRVKDGLRSIPSKGLGYGALFGYIKHKLPKISFNYLGQIDQNKSGADWSIVPESCGICVDKDNEDDNVINVIAIVNKGEFNFSITAKMHEAKLAEFVNSFKCQLEKLATYTNPEITYSINDFAFDFKDCYAQFNPRTLDNSKILFMFPPGSGGYESYINSILPILSTSNVIAFNNYYQHIMTKIKSDKQTNIDYTFLAQFYMQFIKKLQPQGPYYLFGWSFGGILAFEIARQLEQQGETIRFLGLLDPLFNYTNIVNKLGLKSLEFNLNCKYTEKHY